MAHYDVFLQSCGYFRIIDCCYCSESRKGSDTTYNGIENVKYLQFEFRFPLKNAVIWQPYKWKILLTRTTKCNISMLRYIILNISLISTFLNCIGLTDIPHLDRFCFSIHRGGTVCQTGVMVHNQCTCFLLKYLSLFLFL